MHVLEDEHNWLVNGRAEHMREVAFQPVEPYIAPQWPDTQHPQQLHLDITVEDFDSAIDAMPALGAVGRPGAPETGYRVFDAEPLLAQDQERLAQPPVPGLLADPSSPG